MNQPNLDPTYLLETGFAFWPSKVLLTAVKVGVFTTLGAKRMTAGEIQERQGWAPRGTFDFLDTLVSLNFLEREGEGASAKYGNTPETAFFLDKSQPSYVGGILEMANDRLYKFWGGMENALKTGKPQNEVAHGERSMFDELYRDPARLEQFLSAMRGISAGNFAALAEKFDFSKFRTLCDVGGATGVLSSIMARKYPQLKCTTFDLPVVAPIAQKHLAQDGVVDRVQVASGDFFKDPLPQADVITMGMILHDWNLPNKLKLIRAAYDALPPGGAFIAIENLIDDERRTNAFGLMMSLNMLIEFGDAFDYTFAEFQEWCREVGFQRCEVLPLAGPASAAIAYK